jgi:hypothetical protein
MQLVHSKTKHPGGSPPHQEPEHTVDHGVGRPRSFTQVPKGVLTARVIGQQVNPEMEKTARISPPDWQWDEQGRWI